MSPFIHGRIYPETESSGLVSYTLRALIDPRIIRGHWRSILDIDTLRIYLRTVESPCRIVLLVPAKRDEPQIDAAYESMRGIGVEELPSSVVITPEAAAAFPDARVDSDALAFASTALIGDADIVVSEKLVGEPECVTRFQKLHVELGWSVFAYTRDKFCHYLPAAEYRVGMRTVSELRAGRNREVLGST